VLPSRDPLVSLSTKRQGGTNWSTCQCYFVFLRHLHTCTTNLNLKWSILYINSVRLCVRDGAQVCKSGRPGPARHSRKKNREDATKAGMHSCRSRNAQSSTAVLRHWVSSTRSHSPGPLPSLIHPVYWPVLGSQSLLNPRDHPRYLPPYPIDRTRPGPRDYRHVSRERAWLPQPPLHFPLESVCGDKQGRAGRPG
jgi:hypothetical protein